MRQVCVEVIVSDTNRIETFLECVRNKDFNQILNTFSQDELCELFGIDERNYFNDLVPDYVLQFWFDTYFCREVEYGFDGGGWLGSALKLLSHLILIDSVHSLTRTPQIWRISVK